MKIPPISVSRWALTSGGDVYRSDGYIGIQTNAPGGMLGLGDANTWISRDSSGNMILSDAYSESNKLKNIVKSQTTESLTLTIDAVNGTATSGMVFTQDDVNQHGAYLSISDALSVLPDQIRHTCTLSLTAGNYSETPDTFAELSRFTFGISHDYDTSNVHGKIVFSGTLVTVSGTTTMGVASATQRSITLDSDPGFAADAYLGYFIKVVSGTGIGQMKPIRTHSGTSFTTAGRIITALDGTSEVEIVESNVNISLSATSSVGIKTFMNSSDGQSGNFVTTPNLEFNGITVSSSDGLSWAFNSASLSFHGGTKFIKIYFLLTESSLLMRDFIMDGQTTEICGISLFGGYLRSNNTGEAWLITRSSYMGIHLGPTGGRASAFLFEGSIDNCTVHGVIMTSQGSYLTNGRGFGGTGNGFYGISMSHGSFYDIDKTEAASFPLDGSSGDILLDDDAVTYAEIDADVDDTVVGKWGSLLSGKRWYTLM